MSVGVALTKDPGPDADTLSDSPSCHSSGSIDRHEGKKRKVMVAFNLCPRVSAPDVMPGTGWWAPHLWRSFEQARIQCCQQGRPIRLESACSGSMAEAFIMRARASA
eukprot:2539061-Lingulodinium_polyedra.AAC.1